jgi:hypothetical protein
LNHLNLPPNITIFPRVHHVIERNADNSGDIVVKTLVPKEQITVSYLYYPPLFVDGVNSFVKSEECLAKSVSAIPMEQPTKPALFAVWLLMFIGASTLFYWLVKALFLYLLVDMQKKAASISGFFGADVVLIQCLRIIISTFIITGDKIPLFRIELQWITKQSNLMEIQPS